jgi:hypothetical protein
VIRGPWPGWPSTLPICADPCPKSGILNWILAIGFAVGLVAHAAGYLLKTTTPAEPAGPLADLLYTLGWALWTGAVVAVFVQVFPEWKRRQIERALAAYEDAAGGRKPTGKRSVS